MFPFTSFQKIPINLKLLNREEESDICFRDFFSYDEVP